MLRIFLLRQNAPKRLAGQRWAGAERVSKEEAEHCEMEATLPGARYCRQYSSAMLAVLQIARKGSASDMGAGRSFRKASIL